MNTQRVCTECGEEIMGRVDKRFCSDQCRNSYNNKLNSDSTNFVRNINKVLRKNRRILDALNPSGKTRIKKTQLSNLGFNFTYHTHTYTNKNKQTYYFCYEQGYLQLDDGYIALVKNEREFS